MLTVAHIRNLSVGPYTSCRFAENVLEAYANDYQTNGEQSSDTVGSSPGGLADEWNGKTWTIKTIPHLTGATSIALASMSCASAHACVAVGFSLAGQNFPETPLAEAWNGKTWTIKTTPF
jgi:hypothetical protein